MNNDLQISEDSYVNSLFDDITTENDNTSSENKIENNDQTNIDNNIINETEPSNTEDGEDYISRFLSNYGIQNKTIQYENDDGSTTNIKFDELDDDEKFSILKEITSNNLTENEINTINYLRQNNASLQDVVEYFSNKAVQDYIEKNGVDNKKYSIDDYSDDELYIADLKSKYDDMTDDEIKSDLESAKENEALFKKKVDSIRKQYKAKEDEEANEELARQEEQYNMFKDSIKDELNKFNEISMDYKNSQSDSLEIENDDKEAIYRYLINKDSDGNTQFFKDLNNPSKLIKLAWFSLYGDQAISDISNYWKSQLRDERRKDNNGAITTIAKKEPNKDNFKKLHPNSVDIEFNEDLL